MGNLLPTKLFYINIKQSRNIWKLRCVNYIVHATFIRLYEKKNGILLPSFSSSYKYIFQIFIKTVLYKFKELEKQLIYLRFKSSSIKQTKLCLMNAINKNDNDNWFLQMNSCLTVLIQSKTRSGIFIPQWIWSRWYAFAFCCMF